MINLKKIMPLILIMCLYTNASGAALPNALPLKREAYVLDLSASPSEYISAKLENETPHTASFSLYFLPQEGHEKEYKEFVTTAFSNLPSIKDLMLVTPLNIQAKAEFDFNKETSEITSYKGEEPQSDLIIDITLKPASKNEATIANKVCTALLNMAEIPDILKEHQGMHPLFVKENIAVFLEKLGQNYSWFKKTNNNLDIEVACN